MIQLLGENPLILLFVVASLGYLIGTIKIKGGSLGVAAILFTGLVFGAIDPSLKIPEIILLLGLALFVYSIGLIVMGMVASVVVGVFSGIIPALMASRLDPATALRHE